MITTELVKQLRDQTGIPVMQCKKALEEADGSMEKALVILRKKSVEISAKKSGRTLGSGAIGSYLHNTGTVGAMVILMSETDFVSKNEDFRKLAYDIAMHVAASNPEYLNVADIPKETLTTAREVFEKEAKGKPTEMKEKIIEGKLTVYFKDKVLLNQPYIKNPELSIQSLIEQAVQKFGERIEIQRFVRLSAK
ncbi:MAG: elongation factor Ts [bacterium]|nr:elongation factor Ts [bacterium]